MVSGIIFGIAFGVVLGFGSAARAANWRDFRRIFASLLLILGGAAIVALLFDRFLLPVRLYRYIILYGIGLPLGLAIGAARLASRSR
jgi:hypothetical protein